jgi:hypothetical protein
MTIQATEWNQRQRQWQLQPQVGSTPQSVDSGSRGIHHLSHSDMTPHVFSTDRPLELCMWTSGPLMSASDLEMASYATQFAAKLLAQAPHWQIIQKYWHAAMRQNNIESISFEECRKMIWNDIYCSDGPRWILHTQSGTRFQDKSTKLTPLLINQHGTISQSFMIPTAFNLIQSIWNSLIPFWWTTSSDLLGQSM